MLVDVTRGGGDPGLSAVLGIIGAGRDESRIGTGLYLSGHWNFDSTIREKTESWPELPDGLDSHGVCDSPEQWAEAYKAIVDLSDRKFCVSFVRLDKATESKEGGWRWHKWGPYIGKQDPQCEYLADEPMIETVYTFHVYEVK